MTKKGRGEVIGMGLHWRGRWEGREEEKVRRIVPLRIFADSSS